MLDDAVAISPAVRADLPVALMVYRVRGCRSSCSVLCSERRMLIHDAQDARRRDDAGARRGQKPRILLIDDERAIVESLRYALEKEGYDVLEAGEGGEALELARHSSPDLILLDIMLPGMSGFEICRVLRQESSVP